MVPKKATTLALRSATPHAVIDAISKGEAQTRKPYGAVYAHVLRRANPDRIAGKEQGGIHVFASPPGHPVCIHGATSAERLCMRGPGTAERSWRWAESEIDAPVNLTSIFDPTESL